MQSAPVKEVLSPLHDCLYDFISRRKWLVRGDLTKDHISRVAEDIIEGEKYISGDYEAATNNLHVDAVFQVVNVIADSPSLTSEERETLIESFRPENLHWVSRKGVSHPILRGSMMGNLMSFPILCLINKACFDMASSLRRKRTKERRYRKVIINGDDIAFCGDDHMYNDWVMVTSTYGLVVNREKTGISSEFIELNSRSYQVKKGFLRKPVLSALQPGLDPSCLLTRLWEGMRTLSPGSLRYVIIMCRHDIIKRGVSLSSVPARLRRVLLKEAWFRSALLHEPVLVHSGVARAWPVVLSDFRPAGEMMELYEKKKKELLLLGLSMARGKTCKPYEVKLAKGKLVAPIPRGTFSYSVEWKWKWYRPLMSWWSRQGLPVNYLGSSIWEEDFDDLTVKVSVKVSHPGLGPPPSLLLDAVRPDGVNWV